MENQIPEIKEKKTIEKRVKIEQKDDVENVNKVLYYQAHIKSLSEIITERKNLRDKANMALIEKYKLPKDTNISFDGSTQELIFTYEEK